MDDRRRDNPMELADEVADAVLGSLYANIAKGRKVMQRDGSARRMTVLELKAERPEFYEEMQTIARTTTSFKLGGWVRLIIGLRERIEYLERLCEPQLQGERMTPIQPIDTSDVFGDEGTRPGYRTPEGTFRNSQRPTPVRKQR